MECPRCRFDNPDNTTYCGNCGARLDSLEDTLEDRTQTFEFKPQRLKTGSTLAGRYRIIEELGWGGMGRIYKAIDKEIGERIAIKLIRPEIAANRKLIERFQNELITTRKISHRHVCRMYDLGREGDLRFITMEYVSGEDLKKSLTRMGPLLPRKAVTLAIQICQGLSEAHRLGVVHRDLKPGNIMLDMQGNIRIMDFGIAVSQESKDLTESGVVVGTPKYFSPEQVEGKPLDPRSDIYSLGVILYEMVTGQVPFTGDTTLIIAYKHMSEVPRNPSEFNAQLPPELCRLIMKCMEKDPRKRYQSADEVCAALTAIKEELPTNETTVPQTKLGTKPETTIPGKRFINIRSLGALLLALLVMAAMFLVYDRFVKTEAAEVFDPELKEWTESIAILPFQHLNPESGQENLWITFTEAVIRKLSKLNELKVISLNSVLAYRDSDESAQAISRDLDVNNVISGTIEIHEQEVKVTLRRERVTLTLKRNVSGSPFMAVAVFKGDLENIPQLIDEIAISIARYLELALVEERFFDMPSKASNDIAANSFYQDGRRYELQFYETLKEEDFRNAIENYAEATAVDQDFALAYWRMGNLYEARYNAPGGEDPADLERMASSYDKAYEVDRYSSEANVGMGWYYFYQNDFDRAAQFFKLGYELDPNNAEINFLLGSFLKSIGLYENALTHYERGLELDPLPQDFSIWYELRSECCRSLGRYADAVLFLEKAVQHEPSPALFLEMATCLICLNRYRDAEIQIQEAEKHNEDVPAVKEKIRSQQALLYAALGEQERALDLIKDEDEPFRPVFTSIYGLLGLKAHAIPMIEEGIRVGLESVRETLYSYPFLINNPCYDSLRGDSRFQEILKSEKAKYEDLLSKYGDL